MSDAVVYDLVGDLPAFDAAEGAIWTSGMSQLLADLSITDTVDDAVRLIDAAVANVGIDLPPETLGTIRGAADSLKEAIRIGEIRPQDGAMAWVWVSYYLKARTLTPADLEAHKLRTWLQDYAVYRGWNPPEASHPANPSAAPHAGGGAPIGLYPAPGAYQPPAGHLPAGAQAVAAASVTIGGQTVATPGLSRAAAAAITKAFADAGAQQAKLVAGALQEMLPGVAPGQVPAQMRQLFAATDALAVDVARLRSLTSGVPSRGLLADVQAIERQMRTLFEARDRLEAQMAADDRSRLLDLLEEERRRIDNQGGWIHHTDQLLATLAPLTVVRELEVEVHDLAGAVANDVPKALGAQVTELQTETQALRQQVDQQIKTAEACCEEFQQAQADLGGRSAWGNLARLLGMLTGLGWAFSLAETLLVLLDGQAAFEAVVTDTEALAGWAQSGQGVAPAVSAWADRIAGMAP